MKKALIALSVAAGMIAAAQAENTTTLYGALGFETEYTGGGSDNTFDLETQASRFGIKGTEDLSNGLQVFYKLEVGTPTIGDLDDDKVQKPYETRYAYVGFTGNFGTLTFGQQDSLYKVVTNYNDIFANSFWGERVNYGAATGGSRIPKVISYVSPNFSGFQFGVAGVLDGSKTLEDVSIVSDSSNFSAYQVGAWYNQNGFYAGVAYSTVNTAASTTDLASTLDVVGGAVGYSNDQFKVGFGVQHKGGNDLTGGHKYKDGEKYNLAGEYYYGPHTFRAGVGLADYKQDSNKYLTYGLGYQYNFSKRTYTYVEGQYNDNDSEKNNYQVRVGLRHNF